MTATKKTDLSKGTKIDIDGMAYVVEGSNYSARGTIVYLTEVETEEFTWLYFNEVEPYLNKALEN